MVGLSDRLDGCCEVDQAEDITTEDMSMRVSISGHSDDFDSWFLCWWFHTIPYSEFTSPQNFLLNHPNRFGFSMN